MFKKVARLFVGLYLLISWPPLAIQAASVNTHSSGGTGFIGEYQEDNGPDEIKTGDGEANTNQEGTLEVVEAYLPQLNEQANNLSALGWLIIMMTSYFYWLYTVMQES
ncbi:hypothetical protein [Vagococcus xieshaowenii]|uniref:Uncharacterized protein n=1 Tax=Vagococcus xieshaowenii TaxID=2562451 RepID=A0AAJ5EG82_9ENTE|nr:hypothetical protein [Vagococcus xieshaowenii]QCA29440.1 hypothetical protein E4Z98_08965 [Vagococcus xieshaowenii]TFZ41560.1 hypothetical protein E4031_05040 [Vagococcus xieshaowenii]